MTKTTDGGAKLATIMRDHPAWTTTARGAARVMRSGASTWLIMSDGWLSDVEVTVVDGPGDGPAPDVIRVDKPILPESEIGSALASLVPLSRVRNANLWDAIANGILRQVVTADQARAMYRRFSAACGDRVETPYGVEHLFPDPERMLRLSPDVFGALKMSFTRKLLRVAASAYLEHRTTWSQLEPAELVTELRSVPGIGPWTAGASAADFSGDFSVYQYPDRTIRTCARRAAPATAWPGSDAEFRSYWQAIAGNHISGLTQLVLAWGETHVQPTSPDSTDRPLMGDLPKPVDLLDVLRTYERRDSSRRAHDRPLRRGQDRRIHR
jgi:DNA-3-methyladenine glycosylase II